MSLRILPDLVQGSDEWHDQRRGMVTASVVGRLITVSHLGPNGYDCPECGAAAAEPCTSMVRKGAEPGAPIKSFHQARMDVSVASRNQASQVLTTASGDDAKSLTLLLAAERITGYTDPTYMSDDMLRGIEDEPLAVDKYAEHYAPVVTTGFMVRDDWGFSIGYSPDGVVGDDGLVEVKSRRQKNQLSTVLDDQVPAVNMAQLQCGLLISGRAWIDYISYSGGMALWKKRVLPDRRWFAAIVAAVDAFEASAAEMVATYRTATEGLPATERTTQMEMVI